jgi:hypothetical protein
MITKTHTYGSLYGLTGKSFVLMALLSVIFGLFLLFASVRSLFTGYEPGISSVITDLIYFLLIVVWSPAVFLFIAYMFTDIKVSDKGLHVNFLWKSYLVEWNEIMAVKPLRPFGLFTKMRANVIAIKGGLSVIHKLYGIIYGGINQPSILVFDNISDYDVLIRNVTIQVKKNLRTPSHPWR